MTWPAAITLAIALLGAVLGVINTWNSINDRRLRLRVRPMWAMTAYGQAFGIEVTNLSSFPVTLSEVGLLYGRPRSSTPERAVIVAPQFRDGNALPRRLPPREELTAYFPLGDLPLGRRFWGAYAKTACGEIAHGRSPALEQVSSMIERSS